MIIVLRGNKIDTGHIDIKGIIVSVLREKVRGINPWIILARDSVECAHPRTSQYNVNCKRAMSGYLYGHRISFLNRVGGCNYEI